MAVISGSELKKENVISGSELKKRKMKKGKQSEKGISSPAKRNSSPGVRLVGGRIYDSVDGKSCHQVTNYTLPLCVLYVLVIRRKLNKEDMEKVV